MNYEFLERIKGASLLVAGEVGIDEYIWGDTRRISPEAPVPVVEVDSQTYKLGLAGNVAQNVASLGAKTTLVTVRGDDRDGDTLERMVKDAGISNVHFITDASRPTLRKVRIIAQKQHVVRVDYEKVHALDPQKTKKFTEAVQDLLPQFDGIIVQDYGKGLWVNDTMAFMERARALKKPVFIDPNRQTSLSIYRGATLLTPNMAEAETLCGQKSAPSKTAGRDDVRLLQMARQILETTLSDHAIITCGEWGMVSVSKDNPTLQRIPTFARDVFDVTGAGDTVIAVLALMYVLGEPLSRCMQIANAAAGIVVGQIGTASVSLKELKDELERLHKVGLIRV